WCPPGARWENLECSHELYNSGHLFEAAAAHYLATGKKNLLDIATRNADLLVRVFNTEHPNRVPGHQIVETGLIKLYFITGNDDYLKLARHFLDVRGNSTLRELHGPYTQDHMPVTQQTEAVGHAVRAAYMYAGMTDIAALYNDTAYTQAVDAIWNNIVDKKMYLTGGIGSRHDGEAFGDNYELPNLTAYNETCAAIANVYWNYRMFLLHGHAKYMDVLERSLYNGVLAGVGTDGKSFFYPNPLECDMHYGFNRAGTLTRQPWFDCSCCPTNLCRFMPSVPGYIYAHTAGRLFVNLFIQSKTQVQAEGNPVVLSQTTNYPWSGEVRISVSPATESNFTLCVRIPGWARNQPVPSNLYRYTNAADVPVPITINGQQTNYTTENGYAKLSRNWKPGDVVALSFPMDVHKVASNEQVQTNKGLVALERGPMVYCVEGMDNPDVDKLAVSPETQFNNFFKPDLLGGIEVIEATSATNGSFTAIPYYLWDNRGANKMKVWLPSY
ncbi:MAG: glycoside hydrolase family 127 protein, partial [Mangrovibacterium sp.]